MEIYRTRKVYGKFDDVKSFVSVFPEDTATDFYPVAAGF